ncbi:MAG: 4Fe-4S binding protein [Candidatus Limivicinus sp.]|nr:4Fe-4S binding protein [Candidatus Limivicinus sp.]
MKITQIVFSPTGRTERVADTITARWGAPVRKIDLTDPAVDFAAEALDAEALTLIAVPSYGGRVPAPAAERIAKLRGNQARCVVLTVYGNRAYEDTLLELSDLAAGSGFRVIAAAAAVAEHSILHQYAAGRPDPRDEEQLRGFAGRILEKLRSGAEDAPAIPGNRPYRKAGGAGLVPKATKACTGCGLCAEKCPTGAISKQDPKKTDGKACISCMRCVSLCPHGARKASGLMTSIAGMAIKKACAERKSNELFL